MHRRLGTLLFASLTLAASLVRGAAAQARQPPRDGLEVRQIVTFLFQSGRAEEARAIYQKELRPIYAAASALRRFRAYRETESPEPLDLVAVSSYAGMAGMDEANAELRQTRGSGKSAVQWYGTLSSMTAHHHDQFVEMLPSLGDAELASSDVGRGLTVFEYVRVSPGSHRAFERLLPQLREKEKRGGAVRWSETGRMLVSDGWDYLRLIAINDLGDWHALLDLRRASDLASLESLITARKTIILRGDSTLSVR